MLVVHWNGQLSFSGTPAKTFENPWSVCQLPNNYAEAMLTLPSLYCTFCHESLASRFTPLAVVVPSLYCVHVRMSSGWTTSASNCTYTFSSILHFSKKVKCTLVQALRLCTGRTVHRGSRGIALPFLDHGTRRGWGVSVTPRPLFTSGKDPVPIIQEAGWAPGPVWTGAENLDPHRDSIPGPSNP